MDTLDHVFRMNQAQSAYDNMTDEREEQAEAEFNEAAIHEFAEHAASLTWSKFDLFCGNQGIDYYDKFTHATLCLWVIGQHMREAIRALHGNTFESQLRYMAEQAFNAGWHQEQLDAEWEAQQKQPEEP